MAADYGMGWGDVHPGCFSPSFLRRWESGSASALPSQCNANPKAHARARIVRAEARSKATGQAPGLQFVREDLRENMGQKRPVKLARLFLREISWIPSKPATASPACGTKKSFPSSSSTSKS